jgi:chromate transporter
MSLPLNDTFGHKVESATLPQLLRYFLKLGTVGFGGPVALIGYMNRDLVQRRGWVTEDTYRLGLALAQIMPGPLAAQLAIALGYFTHGLRGATLCGLVFILPSFVIVVAISVLYVSYGGLWWVQACFYGVGAAVIAIITLAAYRLARATNREDMLQWAIFVALFLVTALSQTEIAWLFIAAGLLVIAVRARPRWPRRAAGLKSYSLPLISLVSGSVIAGPLTVLFLFFLKASLFVFGSGLAIVPFLYKGVVQQYGWLNERQFLDAVAVAMITPGPVVITVAFIGYLVAGLAGASTAALAVFLPVYLLTILPAPWFKGHRENAQLKAFVQGATAAATGALSGAVVVLARRALIDVPTMFICMISLLLILRLKLPDWLVVLMSGATGLTIWILKGTG